MYFEELKTGMTVDTAPAVIEKEKMVALLWHFYATLIISDFKCSQNVYKLQKVAFFVL